MFFSGKDSLKINRSVKMPLHRPSMGAVGSGSWVPVSLQYISNYIGKKSSRRDEVSAHEVSIPCLRTLHDKEHGVLQTAGLRAGSDIVLYILFMS